MKSLILTAIYLAKDTLNRWVSRISSPLARVLVVFFLSLCALCFLGSYVITAKALRDKIRTQGGDLVQMMVFSDHRDGVSLPTEEEMSELLDVDTLAVRSVGSAYVNDNNISILSYDFQRSAQFLPLLSPSAGATLLYPRDKPRYRPGPVDITLVGEGTKRTIMARYLAPDHMLMRMMPDGCILVSPDLAERLLTARRYSSMQRMIARVRHLEGASSLTRVETYFNNLLRLEHAQGHVISASRMLREMDVVLSNQTQCRAAFCIGIVGIVGILLTALAGMEYRQNEYIYTLMKSFGIHPFMLVGAFLVENLLLVGASFAAAVAAFMQCQAIIAGQFFKMGRYSLQMEEIMPEIKLIAAMLLICIAFSAIPVTAAANREIGRVLK